jgi:hypothetical protein
MKTYDTHNSKQERSSKLLKLVSTKRMGTGIVSTFKSFTTDRLKKRAKISDNQIQNKKDVRRAGGQCLKCRSNRSKVTSNSVPALFHV